MLMEYGWNHRTLRMLKGNPGHIYLQPGMGPNFAAQVALKTAADPKGLLNPGKLRVAPIPAPFAEALPRFLYA